MQLQWEKCFDVGILQNRVLQMLVQNDKTLVADATMRLEVNFLYKNIFLCSNNFRILFLKVKLMQLLIFG